MKKQRTEIKMSKAAEKALRKSIEHWRRLSKCEPRIGEGIGASDCALCCICDFQCFIRGTIEKCPIYQSTGFSGCSGSPYQNAYSAAARYGRNSPEFMSEAKRMLAFLKSLLPIKKRKRKKQSCG